MYHTITLLNKLIDDTLILSPMMKVTNQAGGICKTDFERFKIFFHERRRTYFVMTDWLILGEYETPAQVEAVILELKAAIKRGDEEFTFPTVEDFNGLVHISEALAEIPAIQKILAQRSLTA